MVAVLEASLRASTPDYGVVVVSWTPPAEGWSRLRLVRNLSGIPSSIDDGLVVLAEEDTEGTPVYNDLDVAPGRRYYYGLFLFMPGTQEWSPAGAAEAFTVHEHGYTDVLWGKLPELYRGGDITEPGGGTNDALYRFLSIFGFELDGLRTQIDSLLDIGGAASVLPALLRQFLFDTGPEIGVRAARQLAANAPTLYNTKGTRAAVENFVSIITGWDAYLRLSPNRVLDSGDSLTTLSTGRWATALANARITGRASTAEAPAPYGRPGYAVLTADEPGPINASPSRNGREGRLHSIHVVQGRYYVASVHVRGETTARMVIDWYDRDGRYIASASGAPTVATPEGWTARPYALAVAPPGAVYAGLRVSADASEAGQEIHLAAVQFEDGALREWRRARAVSIVLRGITNEIRNPDGVTGTHGWSGPGLTSDASGLHYAWQAGAGNERTVQVADRVRVQPGQTWTVLVEANSAATDGAVQPYLRLYAGDAEVGTTITPERYVDLDGWTAAQFTYNVPTDGSVNGVAAGVAFRGTGLAVGTAFDFRNAALVPLPGESARYFDGSTPSATGDFMWEGTPHNSRSHYYARRTVLAQRVLAMLPRFLPIGTEIDLLFAQPDVVGYGMHWGVANFGYQPADTPLTGVTLEVDLRWRFEITYDDLLDMLPPGATYDDLLANFPTLNDIYAGRIWTLAEVAATYATFDALQAAETSLADLKDGPF